MDLPVDQVTRRIASGDPEAFAVFYRQHFDRMYARARSLSGRDESFCLDVVQDAMLKAMNKMHVFEHEAVLVAWLDRIVRRCAIDRIRAEVRRRGREAVAAAGRAAQAPTTREPDAWLDEQIAGLDPDQARLLTERYRFGWTLERIGAALGIGPGAVDGRLRRTIAALRRVAREESHDS